MNKPRIMFDCSSLNKLDYAKLFDRIANILAPLGYALGHSRSNLLDYKDSLNYYETRLRIDHHNRAFEIQPQEKKVFYTFSDVTVLLRYETYIIRITTED